MPERPMNIDREILSQMIEASALRACKSYDDLVHKPRYEEMKTNINRVETSLSGSLETMEKTLKGLVSFADRIKGGWLVVSLLMTAVIILAEHFWK